MKTIRTGVYGLVEFEGKIVVILKSRGPFSGLYDLPGGKIEHGETNINALRRELEEELGLGENDYNIENLLLVQEDFVNHIWEGQEKDEHIIAIVYKIKILDNNFDINYIEQGGDSNGIKLMNLNDTKLPKTNILEKVINGLGKL